MANMQKEVELKDAEIAAKMAKAERDAKEAEAQEIENMAVKMGIMDPADL